MHSDIRISNKFLERFISRDECLFDPLYIHVYLTSTMCSPISAVHSYPAWREVSSVPLDSSLACYPLILLLIVCLTSLWEYPECTTFYILME